MLLCTKHELDMDGLIVCELDGMFEMELPPIDEYMLPRRSQQRSAA